MEWVFLVLILVFITWSAQMVFVYRRQAERIESQIRQTLASQEEVTEQAKQQEEQAAERKTELGDLQRKANELAEEEKSYQSQIIELKQQDADRRPTRHRVEGPGAAEGEA